MEISFTITRTTSNGVMEYLTVSGWRSEEKVKENNIEKKYFNRTDGTKEVNTQKSDCRLPQMKKSITLNYS